MKETLIASLIGGLLASIPNILSAISSGFSSRSARKHEIRMKKLELVDSAKVQAIRDFSDALGACMAIEKNSSAADRAQTLRHYYACFERLTLYVCDQTYNAMNKLTDPIDSMPDDRDVSQLNACLRSEMQSVFALCKKPARNRYSK